jgi:hypothetical protein
LRQQLLQPNLRFPYEKSKGRDIASVAVLRKLNKIKKSNQKVKHFFKKFLIQKQRSSTRSRAEDPSSSIIYTHLTTAAKSSSMSKAPKANSSSRFLAAKPLFRQGKQRLSTDTQGTWLPQAAHRKSRGAACPREVLPRVVIFDTLVPAPRGRPLFTTFCFLLACPAIFRLIKDSAVARCVRVPILFNVAGFAAFPLPLPRALPARCSLNFFKEAFANCRPLAVASRDFVAR